MLIKNVFKLSQYNPYGPSIKDWNRHVGMLGVAWREAVRICAAVFMLKDPCMKRHVHYYFLPLALFLPGHQKPPEHTGSCFPISSQWMVGMATAPSATDQCGLHLLHKFGAVCCTLSVFHGDGGREGERMKERKRARGRNQDWGRWRREQMKPL